MDIGENAASTSRLSSSSPTDRGVRSLGPRAAGTPALRLQIDAALVASTAAVLAIGLDARVAWASDGLAALLGQTVAQTVGTRIDDDTGAHGRLEQWCQQARDGTTSSWAGALRVVDGQGRRLAVDATLLLMRDDQDARVLVGTLQESTSARAGAQVLSEQTRILEMIANGAGIGEILPALCQSVEDDIPGASCSILLLDASGLRLVAAAASSLPAAYSAAIDGAEIGPSRGSCGTAAFLKQEVVVTDVRTDARWEMFRELAQEHDIQACWSVPILSSGRLGSPGQVLGTFGIYFSEPRAPRDPERRVTTRTAALAAIALERDHVEAEMMRNSVTDPLTGLPNRARFLFQTGDALARASRRSGDVAVMFFDIDHFKLINDSFGHDCGDRVLRECATRARQVLRPQDVVARFGGDEFTLLCEGIATVAEAEEIGARVQAALREPLFVDGRELFLTASIGIALGSSATDAEALIGDADAAMYQAKAAGRAKVVRFDERMRARSRSRLRMQSQLRQAITRDELSVLYQPLVDLATGRTQGVEALLRWTSPELGPVSPAEFVPVAEDDDMIMSLGTWVLTQACAQVRLWQDTLSWSPTMSVNVSPRQFTQPDFYATVVAALEAAGVCPQSLQIEVTETTLGDPARTGHLAKQLSTLGVALSIDDFGTGYASLARLRGFPVHEIKIDRSFITGLGTSSEDDAVVLAITGMARALGIATVAEGIETELQLRRASELGCTHGQGFLLGPPTTAADLTARLRDPATAVSTRG